jgi:hypothetical protein
LGAIDFGVQRIDCVVPVGQFEAVDPFGQGRIFYGISLTAVPVPAIVRRPGSDQQAGDMNGEGGAAALIVGDKGETGAAGVGLAAARLLLAGGIGCVRRRRGEAGQLLLDLAAQRGERAVTVGEAAADIFKHLAPAQPVGAQGIGCVLHGRLAECGQTVVDFCAIGHGTVLSGNQAGMRSTPHHSLVKVRKTGGGTERLNCTPGRKTGVGLEGDGKHT